MKTRRSRQKPPLLHRLGWWGLLVVVLVMAYYLGGNLQTGQQRYLYLSPDYYPPGTIQFIAMKLAKGGGIYLVNDAGNFRALIATDPYDGCRVSWDRANQVFISPCSKSTYGVDGRWLSGSSPGGLDQYATTIVGGNLVVDTEQRIEGTPKSGVPQSAQSSTSRP